ncbi:MAG: YcaO-like family protein [Desulfoprunum sp.]
MKKSNIVLKDCLKTFTIDQDKAIRPEDTLARFYARVKQLDCVILNEVKRIDNGRLDIPVYFSICGEAASKLTGTRKQMGKGAHPVQAEASACMELAERFSFFAFKSNAEHFITGDYRTMREQGYPLMEIELLLQSVHDEKTTTAQLESLLQDVPMQWTWATNMTRGEEVLVPFSWFFAINEFNGPSAGNTYEEAALQGVCEIVERHVCSRINREKLPTPAIDGASVQDPVARELLAKFARNGIELYLNDFSLDTGICTVGALAIDRSTFPETSEIVYTAGTTPNPEKSLIRAVTEIAQLAGDFNSGSNYVASGLPKPLDMAEVAYLTASTEKIAIEEMVDLSDDNIRVEVERCVAALKNIGMEVFMIDVRHEQLDIPALYTIVPGTHFRERSMIQDAGLFSAKLVEELISDPHRKEMKFQQMEELLPGAYYLSFYRGKNAVDAGECEAAIGYFDRALALEPEAEDLPYIFSYKGSCLKDLGKYEEAIGVLRQGLAEDEERPDIHNLIGVCMFKQGRYAEAIDHFQRAVALNPASGIDYANIGVNYNRLGEREKAIHFFTIALTIDPSLDFAREQLAGLLAGESKE